MIVERRRLAVAVGAVVSIVALAACSHASGRAGAPSPAPTTLRREVLVTIGSGATFGNGLRDWLHDSWPHVIFRDAFPRTAELVNAAERVVSVGGASPQVSLALDLHATVVAMWLGDVDLSERHSAGVFAARLDPLVRRLRAAGVRVLLGNLSRAQAGAAAYDAAIARVAAARGATVVDLAAALSATPGIGPSSSVDAVTSTRIAQTFAAAVSR